MTATQSTPSATMVEPGTVKMERLLPGPVERVWAYLTESDKRATWLAAGEFDLRIGGEIRLEFDNDKLPNDEPAPAKYAGKGKHSGILSDVLNGVAPRPFWATHSRLEGEYAARA